MLESPSTVCWIAICSRLPYNALRWRCQALRARLPAVRVRHREEKENGTWQLERCQPVFPRLVGIYPSGFSTEVHASSAWHVECLRPGGSWADILEAFDGELCEFLPRLADGDVFRLIRSTEGEYIRLVGLGKP
ncbi:hypothetical protein BDV10DRAFT_54955 [Aspergillus recurvatus]